MHRTGAGSTLGEARPLLGGPVASSDDLNPGHLVRAGSMLYTLVDPELGHEVAYNRWYERDHFYAGCMIGPWLFSGARFVATRDLKDLRIGEEPDLFGEHDGSTLSIYWVIDGKMSEHFDWGSRQVRWLHDNDRMFPHREHVHTNLYSCLLYTSPSPRDRTRSRMPSSA